MSMNMFLLSALWIRSPVCYVDCIVGSLLHDLHSLVLSSDYCLVVGCFHSGRVRTVCLYPPSLQNDNIQANLEDK